MRRDTGPPPPRRRPEMSAAFERLGELVTAALDQLAPPLCVTCDVRLGPCPGPLCPSCTERLVPPPSPRCYRCGEGVGAFAEDLPYGGDLCERCIHFEPAFEQARAAYAYEGLLATALSAIKYGKREVLMHHLSALLVPTARDQIARWHAQSGRSRLVLAPMPMHWRDLSRRTFSQTMILTVALRDALDRELVEFAPHALGKIKRTPKQASLCFDQRRMNLVDTMRARPEQVAGRCVVLIDDVMTTGSSAEEAARALKRAGALKTYVLTLARA